MSWAREWLALLQNKAHAQLQSYPMDFRIDVYDALRMYCIETDIIYFPAMYEEFMEYVGSRSSPMPSSNEVRVYARHSKLIQQQLRELAEIRRLERFAKTERIRFYKGDSLVEKIALTAHYMGLRGGG
jgi:hypothetical protein